MKQAIKQVIGIVAGMVIVLGILVQQEEKPKKKKVHTLGGYPIDDHMSYDDNVIPSSDY